MAKQDRTSTGERGSGGNTTRMRTPFTAEVPDEFGDAKWIPELPSCPDASHDPDVIPTRQLDPMGLLPGNRHKSR